MHRRLARLLMFVATLIVAMLLVAGPATAADESEQDHGTEEATGFGTGDFDPLLMALAAGVVIGGAVFAMSDPGGIEKVHDTPIDHA